MRRRRPLAGLRGGVGLLALLLGGCRVDQHPSEPIADHVALCCKATGSGPLAFRGCRPDRSCRSSESIWLRGPVECGPVEPERCAGGRCCTIALPSAGAPIAGESISGEPIVGEPIGATPATPPPAPAPIVPLPFD